jgi:hypothetical protein
LQNCFKLFIPGFPYNLLSVSRGDIGLQKSLGQVFAGKSGFKVPLLLLGPFSPQQTILLSDLVGCGSKLLTIDDIRLPF